MITDEDEEDENPSTPPVKPILTPTETTKVNPVLIPPTTPIPYIPSPTATSIEISPTALRRDSRSGGSNSSQGSTQQDMLHSPLQISRQHRRERSLSLDDNFAMMLKNTEPETIEEDKEEEATPQDSPTAQMNMFHIHLSSSPNPELSPPDRDADPSCYITQAIATPFKYHTLKDYPVLEAYLKELLINADISKLSRWEKMAIKHQHKVIFENFIPFLPEPDLLFLSRYMHSVQNLKSHNRYFQVLRAECGFYRLFNEQGNTKTWQYLRHKVKEQILSMLNKNVRIPGPHWDFYYNLFNEHAGRIAILATDSAVEFKRNHIRRKSNSGISLNL